MTSSTEIEHLLRELAPQVLAVLLRRYRDFGAAEDAVQEALLVAATRWPRDGLPDSPRRWLVQVAARRMVDQVRADTARRYREELVVSLVPPDEQLAFAADDEGGSERDDTLELLFRSCHPALTPASAIALTLRAVAGLTTAEIARAFLVPEATMAQRISRAKATIQEAGGSFPAPGDLRERLGPVLKVLYLLFSEGYAASSGPAVVRADLTAEALRLARLLHRLVPEEPEVSGLLALMLLTDARRAARTGPSGELVPLDRQDRGRWDGAAIAEGVALLEATLPRGAIGPFQLQAAIAAVHDEAARAEDTDWPQILALYEVLLRLTPGPVVALNHAIAVAMVQGAPAGLALLAEVAKDPRLARHHLLFSVRGHLRERAGDVPGAIADLHRAAELTTSTAEREFLWLHAARLAEG
jgi:RNA polymerase sigma factor (sigma-70 family)